MGCPKIAFISPTFYPETNGIAGHSTRFIEELSKNYEITIITSSHIPYSKLIHQTKILPIIKKWSFLGLIPILKIIYQGKHDRIFIQYLPYLYNERGGINFSIALYCLVLRFAFRKKIDVYCHELYYPLEANRKTIPLFFSHILMLLGIGIAAQNIITTTRTFQKILNKLFFLKRKNTFYMPVGSNISKINFSQKEVADFRNKINIGSNPTIGCFSTLHPTTNFELIFSAIYQFQKLQDRKYSILFIGPEKVDLLEKYPSAKKLESNIIAFKKISDIEISQLFSCMDIFISYFSDGATTRRGSIMCALEHNVPSVLSKSKNTEDDLLNLPNTFFLDTDPIIYENQLMQVLQDFFSKRKNTGISNIEFSSKFSWPKIIKTYNQILESSQNNL